MNKAFTLILDGSVIAGAFLLTLMLPLSPHAETQEHGSAPTANAAPSSGKRVHITAERVGDETLFLVDNRELGEITATFDVALTNLQSTVPLPHTATFPPGQVTEAFRLTPRNTNETWGFDYVCNYKLGSAGAQHDDSYVYTLPYPPGETFRVTQGYDGRFSHTGPNQFSIDWALPEGTPVCAARGGLVIKVKDWSDRAGPDISFDRYNNFIVIRHEDGTLGQYAHLLKDSAAVKEGDTVDAGQIIARSGNTGFSSGPHLHFSVFRARTGKERESIPVKFRTANAAGITLKALRRYTAATPALAGAARTEPAGT